MLLHKEMIINDAERFSEQLHLLQEALQKANEGAPAYAKPVYRETDSPNCSPARRSIN